MPKLDFEINPDISQAWTPPGSFYQSEEIYKLSLDKVFSTSWQFVGDTEDVKIPGQATPVTMLPGSLDEPLLLTRDHNDKVNCISNVCTHRGNLVVEGACVERTLKCRYHGRRFELDGTFKFMPEFEGVQGFPAPCDNLAKLQHGQWGPWLMASINPSTSFEETLKPMMERLSFLPLDKAVLKPERARDYMVQAHWALYLDNYLEGFHIPYIHAGLNEKLDYGEYNLELYDQGILQLGTGKSQHECFDIPAGHPDHGQLIAAYYYWFFPNTMFNFYPWGCSINVVRPLGPSLTKVSFIPYVWDESKLGIGAGAELDRVEREDEAVVNMVQRGLRSRIYKRGRYSVSRENGTHHFHRLLVDALER